MEEVAGQQAAGLGAKECPPGGVQIAGSRPVTPGPQDPPDGRLADVVTETSQFPVLWGSITRSGLARVLPGWDHR